MKSRLFIYVALAADLAIAITKFIGAALTRSSAMISEGIHSIIDSGNQILLLVGIRTSKKKADEKRPFGYGKELYFWSFVVSLVIFSLGGCVSFYEGILRLKKPGAEENQTWNYIVLGVAFVFTTVTAGITLKKFNAQRGDLGFWQAIKESKDPSVFIVLLGDLGDLLGLVIAFLGVYLGHLLHNSYYDGVASMIIGVMLIGISGLLLRECRSLLMGEAISKKTLRNIIAIAEADPSVVKVKRHFSMYMAPDEVVLQLITIFNKDLKTQEITEAIQRVIRHIQERFPRVKQIFIEPV
jgi:cation diffusion facilitator family transporter